jgi:hypothetical protein
VYRDVRDCPCFDYNLKRHAEVKGHLEAFLKRAKYERRQRSLELGKLTAQGLGFCVEDLG